MLHFSRVRLAGAVEIARSLCCISPAFLKKNKSLLFFDSVSEVLRQMVEVYEKSGFGP